MPAVKMLDCQRVVTRDPRADVDPYGAMVSSGISWLTRRVSDGLRLVMQRRVDITVRINSEDRITFTSRPKVCVSWTCLSSCWWRHVKGILGEKVRALLCVLLPHFICGVFFFFSDKQTNKHRAKHTSRSSQTWKFTSRSRL